MKKINLKTLIFAVAVIVIVAGIIYLLYFFSINKQTANTETTNNTTTQPNSTQDTGSQNANVVNTSISYADALVKYADKRIQLDPMCQAHPNNITYKDNTGIMIDNRSEKTRTVKIGATFTIKPWGFKIVVLPDVYLKSKTILVDCDQSQNVATILVQE